MSTELTRPAVEALSAELHEPSWLLERRLDAFDIFEKLEDPDPKSEDWRYVDVRGFDFSAFAAPRPRSLALDVPEDLAKKGVIFTEMRTAVTDHPELVQEHFFTDVPVDEHKFTALHAAFFSEGVVLYVPPGVKVEFPLEVLRRVDSGGSTFPHTSIVVDENASLTFVDRFASDDAADPALCASVVEVEARRGRVGQLHLVAAMGTVGPAFPDAAVHGSPRFDRAKPRRQPRLEVRSHPGRVCPQG